jgi:hypothetical protein
MISNSPPGISPLLQGTGMFPMLLHKDRAEFNGYVESLLAKIKKICKT